MHLNVKGTNHDYLYVWWLLFTKLLLVNKLFIKAESASKIHECVLFGLTCPSYRKAGNFIIKSYIIFQEVLISFTHSIDNIENFESLFVTCTCACHTRRKMTADASTFLSHRTSNSQWSALLAAELFYRTVL